MSGQQDIASFASLSNSSNSENDLLPYYQQILVDAGYVVLSLDAEGQITEANTAVYGLTGHKAKALIGISFTTLVQPEWREKVYRFQRKQQREKTAKTTTRYPIFTRDGNECWVEQIAILMNADSDAPGLHLLLKDVTVARQHELEKEALLQTQDRSVFDAMFAMVMLHDGHRILEVNAAFLATFGYTHTDALGMPPVMCLVESEREKHQVTLTSEETQIFQSYAVKKDGTQFPVNIHTKQIKRLGQEGPTYIVSFQDMTEEEEARQQLRTRDKLYRTLARNLPNIGVMLFDHDLRFIIVEGQTLEKLGFTKETAEGKTIYEVFSETDLPEAEATYRAALAGHSQTQEYRANKRYYVNNLFPAYDQKGEIYAGMIVIQDVTEHKRIEYELRENEQRYRGLFEQNNDAVFIIGLTGEIISANKRAADMLGYDSADALIGQIAEFTSIASHASTSDMNTDDVFNKIISGEPFPMYERELTRKDGSAFFAEINTSLTYDIEGMPSHIQSIVRDISERKTIEAKLEENVNRFRTLHEVDEELAEHLNMEYVLSLALDSAMRLSGANIGFIGLLDEEGVMQPAKILGDYPQKIDESYFTERKGIVGRVMRSQEPEVVPDVSNDPDYVINNLKTQAQMVIPLVSRERLIGVVNLESFRNDRFDQDKLDMLKLVTARIAIAVDNARLYRQTETQLEQLRNLYAQVSNLEQIKTDMIRIASHDLRNPLSAIMGFLEILDLDLGDIAAPTETRNHLVNMERAARRMEKIIDDILSLERIEENAQKTEDNYIDLTRLVEEIYKESEPQAILYSRFMSLEMPEGTVIIRGDEAQLREAIANLISNAMKYTNVNGHIDIRVYHSGGKVILEVADDGFGIPAEAQEKLFQPFYRVDMVETSNIEGTGLGLHLVKKIIERHSGKMLFESEYGVGSTFGFAIPFVMD